MQSQQQLLADKEEEMTARLTDLDFTHKSQLSGEFNCCHFFTSEFLVFHDYSYVHSGSYCYGQSVI